VIMSQTRSQKYSQAVFELVRDLVNAPEKKQLNNQGVRRYKALCKRSGSMLRTVGLIQFLIYLKAKAMKNGEEHHRALLEHVQSALGSLKILESKDTDIMIDKIRKHNLPEYMRLTREVLHLLQWHKRISDILIQGTAAEGDD